MGNFKIFKQLHLRAGNLQALLVIFGICHVTSFASNYYILPFSPLYALRILLGVISLMLVPGYLLSLIFDGESKFGFAEKLGFSLIFGLALQAFNVILLWVSLDTLFIGFTESIYLLTLLDVLIVAVFLRKRSIQVLQGHMDVFNVFLLMAFVISLFLRLWYQSFNTNYITPDGAYYCDIARNIVEKRIFKSSMLITDPVRSFFDQHGFHEHTLVPFTLALFFAIGGVNYFSTKLTLLFTGALLVFPTYKLSESLFNKRAGLIAAFIIALHPLLLFYSSILFGNEMINNLYFIMAFYFLILTFKHSKCFQYPILSGIFLYLSRMAWYHAGWFILTVPLLSILLSRKAKSRLFMSTMALSGLTYIISEIFHRSTDIFSLPYLFCVILIVILVCVLGLKNRNACIKGTCLFFLSYVLLRHLALLRVFRHYEFLPSSSLNPLTESVSSFSSVYASSFLDRAFLWFKSARKVLGYPLLILSGISLLISQKPKSDVITLVYPAFYSIIFILYSYVGFEDRFFIPLVIFLSMLSSSVIEFLLSLKGRSSASIKLNVRKLNKTLMLTLDNVRIFTLILLVSSSLFYYGQYFEGLNKMREIDPVGELRMEPTVQWIVKNTLQNATLMNSNPTFYSWFTNRRCVVSRNLNLTQLYNVINVFHVDYFVMDPETRRHCPEIYGFIVRKWREPLPGFSPVFCQRSSYDAPEVVVYDVKKAQSLSLEERHTVICDCSASERWYAGTFYYSSKPTLEVDYINCVEGNGSVVARSTHVPRNSDIHIIYRSLKPLNLSDAHYLHLWIKSSGLSEYANVWQVEISISDLNGHWGSWDFNQWMDGEWQELYLPLGSYAKTHPSGTPDLNQVTTIIVKISNRGQAKPLAVWVDGLEVITYV